MSSPGTIFRLVFPTMECNFGDVMRLAHFHDAFAAIIVDYQFGVIHQRQAKGSGVTEELVAEAAEDAGDKFGLHSLSFFYVDDVIQ